MNKIFLQKRFNCNPYNSVSIFLDERWVNAEEVGGNVIAHGVVLVSAPLTATVKLVHLESVHAHLLGNNFCK